MSGLYGKIARTAVRAAPVYLGSLAAFVVVVATFQLATGEFDMTLTGVAEDSFKLVVTATPAYLTTIAIVHVVVDEQQEVNDVAE